MLSQYEIGVIAWYIYIRSGFVENFRHDTFDASRWARIVIYEIAKIFTAEEHNLNEVDNNRYKFYKEIISIIESGTFCKLSDKIIQCFNSNNKNLTGNIPEELISAIMIYKDNKSYCSCIKTEGLVSNALDLSQLFDDGPCEAVIKELIREYVCLDESIYAAVSGDGCATVMEEMLSAVGSIGEIVYSESVPVTEAGKRQWVRLQYAHESHWNEKKLSSYMHHKAHGVRIPGSSVGIIFFKKKDKYKNIRILKEDVRKKLGSCVTFKDNKINPHVHFPDTHLEVKWVANAALNKNSIEWMNSAPDSYPKNWSIVFQEYRIEMNLRNDSMNYCLDTGAVMALYGIRDTSDVEYISIGETEKTVVNERLGCHNSQYVGYDIAVREIIEDPRYHFIYKNIKSSTLTTVQSFKSYRSTLNKHSISSIKDAKDILLIKRFLEEKSKSILKEEINNTETKFQDNKLYKKEKLFSKRHFIKHDVFYILVKSVKAATPKASHVAIKKIYYKLMSSVLPRLKRDKILPRTRNILG